MSYIYVIQKRHIKSVKIPHVNKENDVKRTAVCHNDYMASQYNCEFYFITAVSSAGSGFVLTLLFLYLNYSMLTLPLAN